MTFAMFLFGLYTLITGDFALTQRRVASPVGARLVGLLFTLSFPVNVLCPLLLGPAPEPLRKVREVAIHLGVAGLFCTAALVVAYLTTNPRPHNGELPGGAGSDPYPPRPQPRDERIQRGPRGFRDW
jgi:hypothetical protein